MEAHEQDLQSEGGTEELACAIQGDCRSADLEPVEAALLDYAVKVATLRQHGCSDDQIVDAVHCASYFNFINRVLDGLGVDPEPFMRYR